MFICVTPACPIVDSLLLHGIEAAVVGVIDYEVRDRSIEIF